MRKIALLLCLLALGASAKADVLNGLVARYKFDGNGNDALGTYNLTTAGTVPYAAGRRGLAAGVFSAANYFYQSTAGLLSIIQPQQNVTYIWWSKVNASTGTAQRFFETRCGGTNDRVYAASSNDGTDVIFTSVTGGSAASISTGTDVIKFGQWAQQAVVLSTGGVSYYYNSALVASGNLTRTAVAASTFFVASVAGAALDGYLDDLRIHNRALTAAEIGNIYATSMRPPRQAIFGIWPWLD